MDHGLILTVADSGGAVQAVRSLAATRTPRVQIEQHDPDDSPTYRILGVYFRDPGECGAYQRRLTAPVAQPASQLEWVTLRVSDPPAADIIEAIDREFRDAGYHGEMVTLEMGHPGLEGLDSRDADET